MTEILRLKETEIGNGIPKICVPMVGSTKEELVKEAEALVKAGADMAEWRADFFADVLSVKEVVRTLVAITDCLGQIPLIFTIRTAEEGGNLQISPKDYGNLNRSVAQTGLADLIDIEASRKTGEMKRLIAEIHEAGTHVIASCHDFSGTPERKELLKLLKTLEQAGGDVLKIAVTPRTLFDVWELLECTNDMTVEYTDKPVVTVAMGDMGSLSRFSGEVFGSAITFGVVGKASAPGQIPIEELRDLMDMFHHEAGKAGK